MNAAVLFGVVDPNTILALMLLSALILPAHVVAEKKRTGWTFRFKKKPSKSSLLYLLIQYLLRQHTRT